MQERSKSLVAALVLVSILFIVLVSCSKRMEHPSTITKEVGNLRFTVAYDPVDRAAEEEENKNEIEYFRIKLEQTDDRDIVEYLSGISGFTKEEVLYYLSYRMKDDIFLEQGAKKEGSVLYHFERSFDLRSGRVFNTGFVPVENHKKEVTLLIDSELLNTGPIKFKF